MSFGLGLWRRLDVLWDGGEIIVMMVVVVEVGLVEGMVVERVMVLVVKGVVV